MLLVLALLIIIIFTPSGFAEAPALEWSYTFDSHISPLSNVSSGFLYIGSGDGYVYAVQTAYGRPSWKYDACVGIISTPVYQDGTIYFGAGDGQFYAVETEWGTQKWKFKAGAGMDSSPIVYKDMVIFVSDSKAYALDMKNGTEIWNRSMGKELAAWLTEYDNTLYVATSDGNVTALDPYYGGILWQARVGDRAYAPLAYNGNIYVGTSDGNITAIDNGSGVRLWAYKAGGAVNAKPAGAGGIIYAGSQDGCLYALDAKNGGLMWAYKTGGPIIGSPIVDRGIVYVGSGDGSLYALDALTGYPGWAFSAGSPVSSTPVIGDGRIYFYTSGGNMSGNRLYSLFLPDKFNAVAPSPTLEPSPDVIDTITSVPTSLPTAHPATPWCPIPGFMVAFFVGAGIYQTMQGRMQ